MENIITTKWVGGMAFEAEIDHHKITIDAHNEFGGEDKGPTPKPLLLISLAGCTGMDVTSLLKKMRVYLSDFEIEVVGELTEEHPKYYKNIHLKYTFKGVDLDKEKIEKAVNLSQEIYCGVYFMLNKTANITTTIEYNTPA